MFVARLSTHIRKHLVEPRRDASESLAGLRLAPLVKGDGGLEDVYPPSPRRGKMQRAQSEHDDLRRAQAAVIRQGGHAVIRQAGG